MVVIIPQGNPIGLIILNTSDFTDSKEKEAKQITQVYVLEVKKRNKEKFGPLYLSGRQLIMH